MICTLTRTALLTGRITALLLFCCVIILPNYSFAARENSPVTLPTGSSQRFITIDFNNVDIRLFIKYISELSGKNFIIDNAVKGTVSIISPTKISEEEAYKVFESVLSVNGYTTIKSGAITKIVPSVKARSENTTILHHGDSLEPADRIVTRLIPLAHSTPAEMKKVLSPLIAKTSMVIAHTPSGMLIVTDTLSNIQKLLSIVESLDVDYSSDELEVVPLEYATASTLATTINTIFQSTSASKKGISPTSKGVKIVPYDRINAIILLAGAGDIHRVKRLIAMLDAEPEKDEGNIQVVYLQHASAKELATILTSLSSKQQAKTTKQQKAPAISSNVKIMPDEETNALIITASRSEFKVLDNVIKKLDIPRRMVYLEALIMEVDTDATFEVGVQWIGGGTFADNTGALLGGWGASDGFNLNDAIGTTDDGVPSVGQGFSLGVLKQGIEIGGITFPNIAAILKAYKKDTNINIIATPQILTTDNKKATISVGENRPYQTSRSEGDNSNTTGYNTYEYKDVATTLSITPHINQADTLRLEISTEVSKFNQSETSNNDRPVTYKRTTENTVLVQDNDTIVIGGIIGHDATESEWKIPLLGDIPILGWLFKTNTTDHTKTNMFIFVTPHIIKNPADIVRITIEKEERLSEVMSGVNEQLHPQVNLDHALTLSDIGFQRLQEKRYDEARNYFLEALEIDPGSPYALMNLGVISEYEGKNVGAISYYQQVLDLEVTSGDGELEGTGAASGSLKALCRENIQRLMPKQDGWPHLEKDEM